MKKLDKKAEVGYQVDDPDEIICCRNCLLPDCHDTHAWCNVRRLRNMKRIMRLPSKEAWSISTIQKIDDIAITPIERLLFEHMKSLISFKYLEDQDHAV